MSTGSTDCSWGRTPLAAQGFEYDWSGVIIGPDLVWHTDHWVVGRSVSKDPSFTKATPDDDVDRLIPNTYKALLTRGMVGTILYSTDAETREKLCSLIYPASRAEVPALVWFRVCERWSSVASCGASP